MIDVREFLSTYTEVHSFIMGIYAGLTEWRGIDSQILSNPDVQVEPHYCYGGYILGTLLRWGIILMMGYKFFG